ncbi:uncharacterized protein YjeT (DUF2065 family) [Sphingomonas kyeonggiensis]|uniref:hypothetical protein n=1 Tax=Sphingomonas kyeonggiensis TaxID=1268553 RepID=UPI0027855732|nr:hypothetical protein [Sphingomonas kyeonggiensis]MDQ0250110.1 uncharacterized protein YjeT (DUF2065 family) [Sphingomonas kyeonggiensis]
MAGLLPLMLAVAAWSGTVEHRTAFGSMTLIQEEWTRDPDQVPMIHAPNAWKKLHLRWDAREGDMSVELLDDGRVLQIGVRGHDCLQASTFHHYARRTGEPALWREMVGQLDTLAKACPRVSALRREALGREFAAARDDFVAGVEALKKRAATVVARDLNRCSFKGFRTGSRVIIPDPNVGVCGPMR